MQLGYVSRVSPVNPYEHVILGTSFIKPKDLATQINLSVTNVWGIVKFFSDLLLNKEDGKYVIMKDPNKAVVRLYSVPLNTFEEDDDEDEEDGEEELGDDEEEVEEEEEEFAEDPEEDVVPDYVDPESLRASAAAK